MVVEELCIAKTDMTFPAAAVCEDFDEIRPIVWKVVTSIDIDAYKPTKQKHFRTLAMVKPIWKIVTPCTAHDLAFSTTSR